MPNINVCGMIVFIVSLILYLGTNWRAFLFVSGMGLGAVIGAILASMFHYT